ncbi:MAG TPA: DUF835 domain-containing protein [Methanomassiliicoccaceae archaeon]|nr:DUF835 domain-containing protein [Methanomassiliicoccaceae archaeon]HQA21312.1 DUF835 domain-containing protein [Methanomassiliicoccaceae archaeon]HQD88681.1 DUF835 domain-containing protein [Methanomassiliicoccaceae archaeon]
MLRKELDKGRKTLYISKNPPRLLRTQLDFDETRLSTMWLSTRPSPECIPPMNLNIFEQNIMDFLSKNENGIVVLNGLDVLEMWNGFRPVLDVLARAQVKVNANGSNLLISLDPHNHYPQKLEKLENISDEVISSYA